jgi:flagellar hook-associated protein 1
MSGSFGNIQQAASSINAATYGLQVVSQNIANANTPGYTRQASQQQAADGVPNVPSIYTQPTGMGGVNVVSTTRLNDPVLDARSRSEHARSAVTDTTADQLATVEDVFAEPSDNGLTEQLNTFWNAWAPVANDPGATAPRTVLLQSAATVASTLNAMSASLSGAAASSSQSLSQSVAAVNSAATELTSLNGQIAIATATGADANSLLDQRDQVLDQLSHLAGGLATINANGSADVVVGGQSLVSGTTATMMTVDAAFQISVAGTAVALTGGTAAANVTALTLTVPNYQAQLDAVANALRTSVNAAQGAGYDSSGAAGTALFSGTGAASIAVAITDPRLVAAAATPGGNLDGTNALRTSSLGTAPGAPDPLYTALIGNIGSESALAQHQRSTQDAVAASVDTLRTAASGVSTDEEVSNMLTYQRAFQASSRVLTTMDSMLDTLINHTGLVGLS